MNKTEVPVKSYTYLHYNAHFASIKSSQNIFQIKKCLVVEKKTSFVKNFLSYLPGSDLEIKTEEQESCP